MYCFFCRDPSSASLVFGNAAMSTLSLVSSASMTAVLHLLLICRMFKLGLMLLMFQQAMQSAGNFVLLFRMLLGTLFTASCQAYTLWAPLHPKKQAVCGGSTAYWLGANQLKAGGSWSVGYANRDWTFNLELLCILCFSQRKSTFLGRCKGEHGLPMG